MGAWAYDPFGNDAALDFTSDVTDPIVKLIKKFGTRRYYTEDEVRAAAAIVISLEKLFSFDNDEVIKPLLDKLKLIRADRGYTDNWNEPKLIIKDLDKQIRALNKIYTKINESQ